MASFITNLVSSIFTPGPTPTLIVATNVSFAALQAVLLALLVATYSAHFVVLSFLSAGLWWAINWFVTELEDAKIKEKEARHLRQLRREQSHQGEDDSGTETEGTESLHESVDRSSQAQRGAGPETVEGASRKRRSVGEGSGGELSTDSEWDKVEEDEDMGR